MNTIFSSGKTKNRKGIAALFSVVMAAEIVIVATAVYTIALKEQQLSTLAEDSIRAFIAAESAIECVVFQDVRIGNFGTDTPAVAIPFDCASTWTMTYTPPTEDPTDGIRGIPDGQSREYNPVGEVTIGYGGYPNGPCADIYLFKDVDGVGAVFTTARAVGRNTCDTNVRNRLERGVSMFYPEP